MSYIHNIFQDCDVTGGEIIEVTYLGKAPRACAGKGMCVQTFSWHATRCHRLHVRMVVQRSCTFNRMNTHARSSSSMESAGEPQAGHWGRAMMPESEVLLSPRIASS